MDLWLASLRNATSVHSSKGPALIDIFPLAISLLAMNLDLLGKAILIIDGYLLLDGSLILQVLQFAASSELPLTRYNQTFGVDLFTAFRVALSSAAVSTNLKDMLISLNLITQVAPSEFWGGAMHTSGLFSLLMKNIAEGEVCCSFL
jgi:hypothetical protein